MYDGHNTIAHWRIDPSIERTTRILEEIIKKIGLENAFLINVRDKKIKGSIHLTLIM